MLFLLRKTYFSVDAGRWNTFNMAGLFRLIAVSVLIVIRSLTTPFIGRMPCRLSAQESLCNCVS